MPVAQVPEVAHANGKSDALEDSMLTTHIIRVDGNLGRFQLITVDCVIPQLNHILDFATRNMSPYLDYNDNVRKNKDWQLSPAPNSMLHRS